MGRIYVDISIHALRTEGDHKGLYQKNIYLHISIHALRTEGDNQTSDINQNHQDFYPRPPYGGRLLLRKFADILHSRFLSTPSVRRATFVRLMLGFFVVISIHALRTEGDAPELGPYGPEARQFLSTPSVRRATVMLTGAWAEGLNFYPRPPYGGRQLYPVQDLWRAVFLSTPSVRRATVKPAAGRILRVISIHALRTEGDRSMSHPARSLEYFYPRPPYGGRRCLFYTLVPSHDISIHALRTEGDDGRLAQTGGQLAFLSTPSVRRATQSGLCLSVISIISIHALRTEGDVTRGGTSSGCC